MVQPLSSATAPALKARKTETGFGIFTSCLVGICKKHAVGIGGEQMVASNVPYRTPARQNAAASARRHASSIRLQIPVFKGRAREHASSRLLPSADEKQHPYAP